MKNFYAQGAVAVLFGVIFCFSGCKYVERYLMEEMVKDMLCEKGVSAKKVLIMHKAGYKYEGIATCSAGPYTVKLKLDITFDGHVMSFNILNQKELDVLLQKNVKKL